MNNFNSLLYRAIAFPILSLVVLLSFGLAAFNLNLSSLRYSELVGFLMMILYWAGILWFMKIAYPDISSDWIHFFIKPLLEQKKMVATSINISATGEPKNESQ